MQYLNTRKAIGLILALAFFIGGTHTALAVGTASGATISNTATVDYDVAGDARSASGAAPNITVDNRVDLTVANLDAGNNVNTTPGGTDEVLTYSVTNTGNTSQGYALTVFNATGDDFDMTNVRIYIEDGTTPGFQSGEDSVYTSGSGANAFDLAADATSVNVYIVADTPAAATDLQAAGIELVATTLNFGTAVVTVADASPDADPSVLDVVFADGDGDGAGTNDAPRDGKHLATATYTVQSALLSATKTIANVADEFNATGGFSIPGAVVRYLITTTAGGTGTVDANTVVVSDPVPANTKLCVAVDAVAPVVCTAADVPTYAVGTSGLTSATLQYSDDSGATWTYSPTADGDGADTAVTNVRYTTTGTVANGGAFTVTIGVVIE